MNKNLLIALGLLLVCYCSYADDHPLTELSPMIADMLNDLSLEENYIYPAKVAYLHQEPPQYPQVLRRHGNQGMVQLHILINGDGSVDSVSVEQSDHPALEREAVRATLKSSFQIKGMQDSTQKVRVIAPLRFSISEPIGSLIKGVGVTPYKFPTKSSPRLPADFQYDKAPSVKIATAAVYPYELLSQSIKGKATISIIIDSEGKVRRVTTLNATHPEFGASAKAMMESWVFNPAMRNGEPTWTAFSMEKVFDRHERDMEMAENTDKLLDKLKQQSAEIHTLQELDKIPQPLYRPLPLLPPVLDDQTPITEKILVEFILDESGFVQLPHSLAAKNQDLAWSALTAISRWQFEPATIKGIPVKAKLVLPVAFN